MFKQVDKNIIIILCSKIFLIFSRPGAWNQKSEGIIQVLQVSPTDMPVPPEVERLKERSKTMVESPRTPKQPETTMSLTEVK